MPKPPIRKPQSLDIQKTIRQAVSLHQRGKLKDAERLYQTVLKLQPRHFDALHLLGVLRGQQGDQEAAIKFISLSLTQNPQSAEAHSNLGIALIKLNRLREAVASFDEALAIKPSDADVLNNHASILLKLSRYEEAVASYDKLLELRPDADNALYERGNALHALQRYEEATASFDRAIALRPDAPNTFYQRGNALHALQRYEEAIASYERALALRPTHSDALNNRGTALLRIGRHDEALASLERALEIRPDDFDILVNRGTALAGIDCYDEAVASYDKALAINPDHAELLGNRGHALVRAGRNEEAILSYDTALKIAPDNVETLTGRGVALLAQARYTEAISSFDRALEIRPTYVDAFSGRGEALARLKRYEEAVASYERALALEPDLKYIAGSVAYNKAHLCDWRDFNSVEKRVVEGVRAGKLVSTPFSFLRTTGSPTDQLACATLHVRDRFPTRKSRHEWKSSYHHDRIRIAYLSADFHDHAVAYLMAGLFEQHDRAKIEAFAISFGPEKQSNMRSRLMSGFERFVDVQRKSDEEVASLLRKSEVDIAVDLMGFTRGARTGIFARRPAPIQVNYLGFPATMGADYIDYIIADEFVIPRDHQSHYAEKIAYLPECFQANDSKRKISERTPTRAEVDLPERGFVFCCFNNSYKLTPQIFDIWMRLLWRVERSVLWLSQPNAVTVSNLQCEAQARSIDPSRLVFAPRVKFEDHLARHRQADLFLDTLPYNAHTTASNALWVGLPVLTCAGKTFAGRVAGSLLHAVGLPELVTNTLQDYEALALKLATDKTLLSEIKEKLAGNRLTKPLFDTDRFRRHIEAAYTTMWEIHQRGEEPRSFAVMPAKPDTTTPRPVTIPGSPPQEQQTLDIPQTIQQALRLHQQHKLQEAEQLYLAILKTRPDHFDALHLLGVLRERQGSPEAAVKLISLALKQRARSADAHSNLGRALAALNRVDEAIASYDRALAIKPDHADALNNRGVALTRLNRHDEAIASYDRALAIKPDHADALSNRGIALARMSCHAEAIASFDRALALKPDHANALNNRGNALRALNRHDEAIASYDKALALKPDDADALNNRSNALRALHRYDEAIASCDKALAIKPDDTDAFYNRASVLQELKRYDEAVQSYDKALAIKPDYKYALGHAAYCRAHICDWRNRDRMETQCVDDVRSGKLVITPFSFLVISQSPADQLTCATTYTQERFPAVSSLLGGGVRYQHDRIRIAYISADFHDHPMAFLMAGLFEQHDRARFETIAISFGRDSRTEMRKRLEAAFDRFIDVRDKSDREVATLLRDLEVDISVDRKGFTRNSRTGIFALRPSPIQVSYLAFTATMGAGYIDYILADRFVIPEEDTRYYTEKVVYLPDTYQVNDSKRKISERTSTRAEVGLPERGFVFCCFNKSSKLTPQFFDIWIRLLQKVDQSVLWLLQRDALTVSNLRREAQARGIDSVRLVFAPRVKQEDHLARHRLADLFLDTLPYNAHTTASDALWAGLPVLTCAGTAFAGRVAGSLLHAVGLPELVTYSLEDYEALALKLATDETLLREIKEKLARNRLTKPLFDTDRFRRHIEAAYTTMWEIHQRGEEPRSFSVTPADDR